jgi:hypothetical protein
MRATWMLAALAGLIAGSAFAQTKIPPSHQYSNQPPLGLDKNYGLPKSVLPDPELPQPKAAAPKETQVQSESFKALPTHASPDAQPSDAPNFFQESSGIAALGTQASDVPNFFEAPDNGVPQALKSRSADPTMDTPLFTTTEGSSTGETPPDNSLSGDMLSGDSTMGATKVPDQAGRR